MDKRYNLPNITRERIDIGLVAVGGDLGAHISQEDSLENDPRVEETQDESQGTVATGNAQAPQHQSRMKSSYSKKKLTGNRYLFLSLPGVKLPFHAEVAVLDHESIQLKLPPTLS